MDISRPMIPPLHAFLLKHKRTPDSKPTHTRIPDKKHRVYGGSWTIPDDKLEEFYELYHDHVCVKGKPEYITEAQRRDDTACLYLDLDFRYDPSVTTRRHEQQHALDLMEHVCQIVYEMTGDTVPFDAYVWERPDCVQQEDVTKDGIHIATTLQMDHKVQQILRERLIERAPSFMGDLPLTNSWAEVFDNSISRGSTNTQMPFSTKPGKEPYRPVVMFECLAGEESEVEEATALPPTREILLNTSTRYAPTKVECRYLDTVYNEYRTKFERPSKPTVVATLNASDTPIDYDATFKKMSKIKLSKLEDTCAAAGIILNYAHTGDPRILDMVQEIMSKASNYDAEWVLTTWNSFSPDKHQSYIQDHVIYKPPPEAAMDILKFAKLGDIKTEPDMSDFPGDMTIIGDLNKEKQKELKNSFDEFKEKQLIREIHSAYKRQKAYFEQFFFKVCDPISFCEEAHGSIIRRKESKATSRLRNARTWVLLQGCPVKTSFFTKWMEDETARSYATADFLPYPLPCPEYVFNTFRGLAASNISPEEEGPRDTEILHELIRSLTAYDTPSYDYMMNYLAHLVQRPGQLPRTALVFRSEQGVGKNMFFDNFGEKVIGRDYFASTSKMKDVTGRFNTTVQNKLMVVLNEVKAVDGFADSDTLKNLITEPRLSMEQKGVDVTTVTNCGRYIFLSNNDTPVKIEQTDRRFVVFEASSKYRNDMRFFGAVYTAFDTPSVVRAFYQELMDRDISTWNSIADRPITEAAKDMASVTVPVVFRFMEHMFLDMGHDMIECQANLLFKRFTDWCEATGFNAGYNIQKFGREIAKIKAIEKRRTTKGNIYVLTRETLESFLREKGLLEDYDPECVL